MKFKNEENLGLNGISTHDLCDTNAVLYQLSYQANWELVMLWVCNVPLDSEECKLVRAWFKRQTFHVPNLIPIWVDPNN